MRFGILGPVVFGADADSLEVIGGPMPRTVLAALLLEANRTVSADRLVEIIWGDTAPQSAIASLYNHVMRLRRLLGPEGSRRLRRETTGYRIEVLDGELDAHEFARLYQRGQDLSREGDWAGAARDLAAALALWRGAPVADAPPSFPAHPEARRLAELRIDALRGRIAAELRLGRHSELIAQLRALTVEHPLTEDFHAQLMLALYRSGRPGEALAAFERVRRALAEELGADPGPKLAELHAAILRSDPGLLAARSEGAVPRQLPGGVRHFVGRIDQLKAVSEVVAAVMNKAGANEAGSDSAIMVVTGTPGVGKTAFAIHVGHREAERFPDGQLYANLQGFAPGGHAVVTPESALRDFLLALGVGPKRIPHGLEARTGLYRSLMARRRMLVVLDNARDAAQVRPLLPGSAGCLTLVTSRDRLAALVAAQDARPVALDVLTVAEARELLRRRLGPDRAAAQAQAADRLIELCARLPLALSIAAARAATEPDLTLAALVDELRDAGARLDSLGIGDPITDVRAVFSWSYQRLSETAARLFRLLAVHPEPDVSPEAAASLAGIPLGEARSAISELTRVHLVGESAAGRVCFHDLLRAFATELATPQETRAALHRCLDHYFQTADAASRLLSPSQLAVPVAPPVPAVTVTPLADPDAALAWYDAEYQIIATLLEQAVAAGFDTYAWQLPSRLTNFLEQRGHVQIYASLQRIAVAAARRTGDEKAEANAHRTLARAYDRLGEYDAALEHLGQALAYFATSSDALGQARVLIGMCNVLDHQGRYAEAVDRGLEALDLARENGLGVAEANAHQALGWYYAKLDDHERALEHSRAGLELHRMSGSRYGMAACSDTIGFSLARLGDYLSAVQHYEQAVALYANTGEQYYRASSLEHLGDAHDQAGDASAALRAWRAALEILTELDHPNAEAVRNKVNDARAAVSEV